MMRVSLEIRPEQIARWLAEDWDELAAVLPLLAGHLLKEDREDLVHFIRHAFTGKSNQAVRDLALMIAGACGEAE